MRLISIIPQKSVAARLDDLLGSRFAAQSLHERIERTVELPWRLEQCVANLAPTCVWRAYRLVEGVFCAVARASLADGASEGGLEVYFVDAKATVYSAGVWVRDSTHGWWLNSLLPLYFDSEYGWGLGALMNSHATAEAGLPPASQELLSARPLRLIQRPLRVR